MKTIIIIILFLNACLVFSQSDTLKLPAKFHNLEFGTTTMPELEKQIGRADTVIDNILEVTYKNGGGGISGTYDALYSNEKTIFRFEFNDSTANPILSSIDILAGSPVLFADKISVGASSKNDIRLTFGNSVSFNDPAIDNSTCRYFSEDCIFIFYFDPADKLILVRIIINKTMKQ